MHRPKAQAAALLSSPEDTEQQFYEALQGADLDRLMEVWADEDEVSCVHPGGPRVVGLGAIRAAFEAVFQQGAIAVHPERVRRMVSGDTAIHQVLERVLVQGAEGQQSAWVISTNVYLKTAMGWRMVVHHASPGTAHDIQEVVEEPATLH
ncbi:nuclear transport factor 2 family protein [Paucibacter sediminis]|uniref:Nuclear transport factor 2 family protein n=1 Tax=Paucibacter sediminis TaxID=3019553 RepID=A0AA95SQK3_9BURK|nr:nuclear transport factor 2 family protein [Paucibacter sp. S2-9]WIT13580.1 nuclear transport factor 2 family protein [Paucibacter sp. S2-9]